MALSFFHRSVSVRVTPHHKMYVWDSKRILYNDEDENNTENSF